MELTVLLKAKRTGLLHWRCEILQQIGYPAGAVEMVHNHPLLTSIEAAWSRNDVEGVFQAVLSPLSCLRSVLYLWCYSSALNTGRIMMVCNRASHFENKRTNSMCVHGKSYEWCQHPSLFMLQSKCECIWSIASHYSLTGKIMAD